MTEPKCSGTTNCPVALRVSDARAQERPGVHYGQMWLCGANRVLLQINIKIQVFGELVSPKGTHSCSCWASYALWEFIPSGRWWRCLLHVWPCSLSQEYCRKKEVVNCVCGNSHSFPQHGYALTRSAKYFYVLQIINRQLLNQIFKNDSMIFPGCKVKPYLLQKIWEVGWAETQRNSNCYLTILNNTWKSHLWILNTLWRLLSLCL